ncbi:Uncharacterised protein [Mycobacteroides abscessus subsp. abscessus]|nr:Uncharacterised protein [Mycobacteroides abscessus subsp. abscessus]
MLDLTVLLIDLRRFAFLTRLLRSLVRVALLWLLALLRGLFLRCLEIGVWLPGPLGVAGIGLVVGYLRAVGRLVPTLLRLLPTLLARNLLHTRRSRVVYADTRVLIQRRLVVAALVVRH